MARTHLPLYMRLEGCAEQEIGAVKLDVSVDGTVTLTTAAIAAALREAADAIENPPEQEVTDAPAR